MNFCPTCGTERPAGQRYCANCGLDFWKQAQAEGAATGSATPRSLTQPAPVAPAPVTSEPAPSGGGSRLPLIIGALVVVGLLVGGGYWWLSSEADRILEDVGSELDGDEAAGGDEPAAEPVGGTGEITFGFGLDENLHIEDEDSSFAPGELGAFSASLSEPAGATSVEIIISSREGSVESVVYTETISVADPNFDVFGLEDIDIAALVDNRPGRYVMRYYRDATLLAEGQFRIKR
jgi:hypothetical protein